MKLITATMTISCPDNWEDEQAEEVYETLEEKFDSGFAAISRHIKDTVSADLEIRWSV